MFYLIFNNEVVQKSRTTFPVCSGMQWVESSDESIVPYHCSYSNGSFIVKPPQAVPVDAYQSQIDALASTVNALSAKVSGKLAAKAWASFSANGTIEASYNVASIVKNSAGLWTITFTTPFSTTAYVPVVTAELTLASLLSFGVKPGTKLVNSVQVTTSTLLGILADPAGKLYFVAYGD